MPKTAKHPYTGTEAALFNAWLRPNGVIGWMPENSTITVDSVAGTVTWPRWRHLKAKSGVWDRDVMVVADFWPGQLPPADQIDPDEGMRPVVDMVTTPLVVPVTDQTRAWAKKCGLNLVERP